jgi:hypothetical protein
MARANIEWVPQVSLLKPWCFGLGPICERNPGLKGETWGTHSKAEGCSLFFDRSAVDLQSLRTSRS